MDSASIIQASVDLQQERLNQYLQEELDKLKAAHHDLEIRYQADVVSVKQQIDSLQQELQKQVDSLQQELQKQMKTHGDRVSQDQAVKRSSVAVVVKNNSFLKSMAEEIDKHQQNVTQAGQIVESLQQ
ncbi:golgin subfamily A member 3-like isoform X2 [Xyrichtys novacula]|uniref:Golgin subfamily A member 3-like isoform X2 n=1 Tax=Xyrichtys novacula TaxID=13765 RepID=A0AAV1H946_XYRNO|nr:golgin subfamily A member 3-like isoform X2 [Xyrichtys novacula]